MLYGELINNIVPTQSKEVTPSTEKIVVVPDNGLYLSKVSVKGVTSNIDPNIKAENIRLGTSILGVEGNLAPDKPDQEKSVVPSKEQQEIVADTGYELAKVVVKATPLEELSVSEDGTYEPSGDNVGFSKVVVKVIDEDRQYLDFIQAYDLANYLDAPISYIGQSNISGETQGLVLNQVEKSYDPTDYTSELLAEVRSIYMNILGV